MHLAFGTALAKDEKKLGVKVGKAIKEELGNAGLNVKWTGKLKDRIFLPGFIWFCRQRLSPPWRRRRKQQK